MKNKVIFLLVFVIIFNTSFIYADNYDVSVGQVYSLLQNDFDYDENTDTYYFPSSDINSFDDVSTVGVRSGTVAVSGAVISAVLTLAVKAGLEFATTNSMSEFVSRFFMLDGISSIVDGISGAIKSSVGGTINFSRSLLDSISSKFAEVMNKDIVTSVYIDGRKFPVLDVKAANRGTVSSSQARYLFESSVLPKIKFDCFDITSDAYKTYDSNIYIPGSSYNGDFSIRAKLNRFSSPYKDFVQFLLKQPSGSYNTPGSDISIEFPRDTFVNGNVGYSIPFLYSLDNGCYYVGFVVAIYSSATGQMLDVAGKVTVAYVRDKTINATSVLPTIGSSWSDGSISSGSDSVSVSIPKDTNTLLNKKPADISTPTYEIWTPGVVVVPPAIDTGTDVPPIDDVLPPIDDSLDVPDTDLPGSGTDTPSIPSLNLDWLKELIQSIIDLIKSIIDWLNNFWTHLWEFLKSLLVPGETYFVDEFNKVTEKMKDKIPGIDITKLEDLAVGEFKFKDMYAEFFGIECLVVRGSLINNVIGWARPIIQGLIALFLLLYNYNQIYLLIRGTSLLGATNTIDNMDKNRVGGRR